MGHLVWRQDLTGDVSVMVRVSTSSTIRATHCWYRTCNILRPLFLLYTHTTHSAQLGKLKQCYVLQMIFYVSYLFNYILLIVSTGPHQMGLCVGWLSFHHCTYLFWVPLCPSILQILINLMVGWLSFTACQHLRLDQGDMNKNVHFKNTGIRTNKQQHACYSQWAFSKVQHFPANK